MIYGVVAAFAFIILSSVGNENVDSGINVGLVVPKGEFSEYLEQGYIAGFNIISRPDELDDFDVGIGTTFSQHFYSGNSGREDIKIIEVSAGPNFYFRKNKLRFIGSVGWGIYFANPNNYESSAYVFNTGFYVGGGINFSLNNKIQIDIIPKYHRLMYPGSNSYLYTLGAYFYFSIK